MNPRRAVVLVDLDSDTATRLASLLRADGRAVIVAEGVAPGQFRGDMVAVGPDLAAGGEDAVRAALRAAESEVRLLRLSAVTLDLDRGVVVARGEEVPLTAQEAALARVLAAAAGEVVGRDRLLREAWGYRANVVSRAVDNAVVRLRAKIEADPSEPVHLLSERGEGYRLVGAAPVQAAAEAALHPVVPPGPLIGRDADARRVAAALQSAAIVTICGAPGVGKSALGRRVAADLGAVEIEPGRVGGVSAPRGTVVFVDDADTHWESIRGASREIADAGLRWLFTSRRPIGLAGEKRIRLAPLSAIDAAQMAAERGIPGARADGLPLCIELLAAAARLMGASAVISGDPLKLMIHTSRRPERHRRWVDAVRASIAALDASQLDALHGLITGQPADPEATADLIERSLAERDGARVYVLPMIAAAVRP